MSFDKALQEFVNVCLRYEHRPTKPLFDYIYDIVEDIDVEFIARQRGYMALKAFHKNEVIDLGLSILQHADSDVKAGTIRHMFCLLLQGVDEKAPISNEFVHSVFRRIGSDNAFQLVQECCKRDLNDTSLYNLNRKWNNLLLQVGEYYVAPVDKLSIAYMAYQNKCLTPDMCQHLLQYRREVGTELWDFFHNLEEPQFMRYRQMGEQFIQGENQLQDIQINEMLGNQNVHKLDKYRTAFLVWLAEHSYLTEEKDHSYVVNNLLQVYFNKGNIIDVINHLKTFTSVFTFEHVHDITTEINGKIIKRTETVTLRWSLDDILRRMIWFISRHKHRVEIEKRLFEELREMRGTCVSGHFNRIFNCLVGFENILTNTVEAEYRYFLREELDRLSKENEALVEAIVMADWNEENVDQLKKLSEVARQNIYTKVFSAGTEDDDEEKWFVDVVYKWSGVKLIDTKD